MAMGSNVSTAAAKFSMLSIGRQVGLLIGLAASIAIGIAVVMWSQEPNYRPLFNQLNSRDSSEVIDVLHRNGIAYKVHKQNGTILVASADVQNARMKLATEGLPRGNGRGFELFSNSNSFTTSQFMETAKLKLALETELARTIAKFNNIKAARVHLAVPRQSAFVRDKRKSSASIFIDVYSGFTLKKQTIASIVNLVASSIPGMNPDDVTVVDQNGQLLNDGSNDGIFNVTDRYLEYRTQLERNYAKKINDLLTPILGIGKVRAKVSADIDFTQTEQTRELYNPDMKALRSEQTMQEKRRVSTQTAGLTGAQANQPQATEQETTKGATTQQGSGASDFRNQSTKNFEIDKTISHTRNQPGRIKRLTVAVLVDNRQHKDEKTGKMVSKALSPNELDKIKLLVADAIGLDSNRGDSLNVINSDFVKPEPIESLPELSMWQQPWFWSVVKQALSALFILILVFGVLKPILKSLATRKDDNIAPGDLNATSSNQDSTNQLDFNSTAGFDDQVGQVKQISSQQPQQVAQVVKSWVDGG